MHVLETLDARNDFLAKLEEIYGQQYMGMSHTDTFTLVTWPEGRTDCLDCVGGVWTYWTDVSTHIKLDQTLGYSVTDEHFALEENDLADILLIIEQGALVGNNPAL